MTRRSITAPQQPPQQPTQQSASREVQLPLRQSNPKKTLAPPTEWPNLYAGPYEPVDTYEIKEYGNAFFFMIFVGPGGCSTYATVDFGFKPDKPLVLPKGSYNLRVGIYSSNGKDHEPVQPPMRNNFYTEKDRINFLCDPDKWEVL
ncbi:uncharacterized protein TRUGW13939_06651 [Talaromyces rugulosus]|uniref:Uncharacterized protein n=1 Tax=Talaromyces rugulosus TaxID=121627 RepID=A0A7H8QZW0_TALRU|nr:uncharacterized protein TRUGW13939_06651 [Talaromyces rugulosus]QKX59517.1 hypothetical protein TRUGW13939_06651 [Talaromyces rugulosus]